MKQIASFIFLILMFLSVQAQQNKELPLGIWTNTNKEARFQIYKCGEKLCGKIIWLKEPQLQGKPKLDSKNPDATKRDQPIMGMVFLKNFQHVGENKWDDGTIYDPQSGKTYSCYMKILDKDKLEVKGYIGISLVGRSQIWTRVE